MLQYLDKQQMQSCMVLVKSGTSQVLRNENDGYVANLSGFQRTLMNSGACSLQATSDRFLLIPSGEGPEPDL